MYCVTVYSHLDSIPVVKSVCCIDSKRHTQEVKCMHNSSKFTAEVETSSDAAYKQ